MLKVFRFIYLHTSPKLLQDQRSQDKSEGSHMINGKIDNPKYMSTQISAYKICSLTLLVQQFYAAVRRSIIVVKK